MASYFTTPCTMRSSCSQGHGRTSVLDLQEARTLTPLISSGPWPYVHSDEVVPTRADRPYGSFLRGRPDEIETARDAIVPVDHQHELLRPVAQAEVEGVPAGLPPHDLDGEAPFRYMRFRDPTYTDEDLREWATKLRAQSVPVYAYFRHEVQRIADASLADIKTKADWEKQRPELHRQFLEMLGLWPMPAKTDLKWQRIWSVISDHVRCKRTSTDETWVYNSVQRLVYLGVVFLLFPAIVWTGLAMSFAVASVFPFLVTSLGGFQSARTLHFVLVNLLLLFIAVHLAMLVLVGFTNHVRAMITGRIPRERGSES